MSRSGDHTPQGPQTHTYTYMNIQSISIVVPTKGCVNNCKFCVSRMHSNEYDYKCDHIQIMKRIKWAVMNGINTCILTGTGEALQNKAFLKTLVEIFKDMNYPFPNTELQTTGVLLDDENLVLLKDLGVNTISLSISDLFNDDNNADIIGISEKLKFKLPYICELIRAHGFNLRLSLNMTNAFDEISPINLFIKMYQLKPIK